jgi:hypothetical protein
MENHYLKSARSNSDLHDLSAISDIKHNQSNILEREVDSPVKKLKKRYGESLIHPYDKDTLVSKSFCSKSRDPSCYKEIIDESFLIEHEIKSNFIPLKGR